MIIKVSLKKYAAHIALSFLLALCFSSYALGAEADQNRTILAFFDSTSKYSPSADENLIHEHAEMVLNYLGMKLMYHDVAKGLPTDEEMKDVLGIISWFTDDSMPGAAAYCDWISRQVKKGKKFLLLGATGVFNDRITKKETPLGTVNKIYNSLGLGYEGDWTEDPFVLEIVEKDSRMVEFERTLENEVGFYERISSLDSDNKIYLKLNRMDIPAGESAAVVTTPTGGFVLSEYASYPEYTRGMNQWRVNPFLFFGEALQLKGRPRYDTTTLFGRRIFYSHIDGDGIRNISQEDNRTLAGWVILDEILKKYELPITASFITADINPEYYGSDILVNLAREILSLPHIETGVHSFTHPLDWQNQLTVYVIKGYSKKDIFTREIDIVSESAYGDVAVVTVDRHDFLEREIAGATEYVNNVLVPEDKKVAIYHWTGNCEPPAAGIALADSLGIQNINGGDSRFDQHYPSYTGIAPLTRQVEGQVQMYTSNANDNIYTNLWTGPFYGFIFVIETFKQTEIPTLVDSVPRRVSPMNVYYHFFSGEKKESVGALKDVYDYVLTQDITPVFTSHYTKVVNGFLSGTIKKLTDRGWEFGNYGECRTVRFDDTDLYPDLKKCKGVIGFNRWHNYLYVHLSEGDHAVLYLTDKPPSEAYLEEASTIIYDWEASKERVSFNTFGFKEGFYRLANMLSRTKYVVSVYSEAGKLIDEETLKSDNEGSLDVSIPIRGKVRVIVNKKG